MFDGDKLHGFRGFRRVCAAVASDGIIAVDVHLANDILRGFQEAEEVGEDVFYEGSDSVIEEVVEGGWSRKVTALRPALTIVSTSRMVVLRTSGIGSGRDRYRYRVQRS